MPVLSGSVIDSASRRPIPSAVVRSESGEVLTDAKGRFALEADPQQWPATITAAASGYAEGTLVVPAARASTAVGEIALTRGASLRVDLEQDVPGDVVAVDLVRLRDGGRAAEGVAKTLPVPGGEAGVSIRFDEVPPGEYVVLAKGDQPCERHGEKIRIAEGEARTAALRIRPFRVAARVEAEGAPLARASVLGRHRDFFWEGSFETREDGTADVTLWQGGRVAATVRIAAPGMVPHRERRTLAETEDAEWHIRIPAREIAGTVVDGRTGDVVAGASVAMMMTPDEDGGFGVSAPVGADGTFRFAPVAPGRIELKAAARGYPEAETAFFFREPDRAAT